MRAPTRRHILATLASKRGDRFTRVSPGSFSRIEVVACNFLRDAACGKFTYAITNWAEDKDSKPFLLVTTKALTLYSSYLRDYHPEITVKHVDPRLLRVVNDELLKWLERAMHSHPSVGGTVKL